MIPSRRRGGLAGYARGALLLGVLSVYATGCKDKSAAGQAPPSASKDAGHDAGGSPSAAWSAGDILISGKSGAAPAEFAAFDPEEAAATCPESLVVSANSKQVWVLDAGNSRLQRFDEGSLADTIVLPTKTGRDVARLANENFVILDRKANAAIVLDKTGTELARAQLTGVAIERADEVPQLEVRPSGVWAQFDRHSVLILDPDGHAVATRRVLPGALALDGSRLYTVRKLPNGSVHLNVRSSYGLPEYLNTQLTFEHPVDQIRTAETDASGRFFIVTTHVWLDGGTRRVQELLTVLRADLGAQERQIELQTANTACGPTRSIVVARDGTVFQLTSEDGAINVRRY